MSITEVLEDFRQVMKEGARSEVAASILVLANSVERASTFGPLNSEDFGHELAMALKHVFEHSTVKVDVGGNITTEVTQ